MLKLKNYKGKYIYYKKIRTFINEGYEFVIVKCLENGKEYLFNENILIHCEEVSV